MTRLNDAALAVVVTTVVNLACVYSVLVGAVRAGWDGVRHG